MWLPSCNRRLLSITWPRTWLQASTYGSWLSSFICCRQVLFSICVYVRLCFLSPWLNSPSTCGSKGSRAIYNPVPHTNMGASTIHFHVLKRGFHYADRSLIYGNHDLTTVLMTSSQYVASTMTWTNMWSRDYYLCVWGLYRAMNNKIKKTFIRFSRENLRTVGINRSSDQITTI